MDVWCRHGAGCEGGGDGGWWVRDGGRGCVGVVGVGVGVGVGGVAWRGAVLCRVWCGVVWCGVV